MSFREEVKMPLFTGIHTFYQIKNTTILHKLRVFRLTNVNKNIF